jgi:hypothetical protein
MGGEQDAYEGTQTPEWDKVRELVRRWLLVEDPDNKHQEGEGK